MRTFAKLTLVLLILGVVVSATAQEKRTLNIYSARHYGATEAPFTAFEAQTGIEIRLSQGSPLDLLERLRAEGKRTPADVFLAIDAGVLSLAASEGLLQPIESEILNANLAESQRDPENYWFALSKRARTLVYNPANVSEDEIAALNSYSDLADPIWAGRICFRPGTHIYTISLTSSLIYHLGEEEARTVVEGWVANNPTYIDSDTSIIKAVAAGECDAAFVNHYYVARLTNDADPAIENIALKWMNQDEGGVFYNVNAAGVTANAENTAEAIEFIEFLSSLEAQVGTPEGFPGANYEYPSNPTAEPGDILKSFGEVLFDESYPLWEYGANQTAAITLLEEAGFGLAQ